MFEPKIHILFFTPPPAHRWTAISMGADRDQTDIGPLTTDIGPIANDFLLSLLLINYSILSINYTVIFGEPGTIVFWTHIFIHLIHPALMIGIYTVVCYSIIVRYIIQLLILSILFSLCFSPHSLL